MGKRKTSYIATSTKAMRAARRAQYVADLREGRVLRPATFADRKKKADKNACRRVDTRGEV